MREKIAECFRQARLSMLGPGIVKRGCFAACQFPCVTFSLSPVRADIRNSVAS